jgi:hypothetical protein
MVEITLSIVLQFVQTAGILVGIIYYITIMRNNQRNQELQLETRKTQLYMQLFMRITSEEFMKKSIDLRRLEHDTYDEFMENIYWSPDSNQLAKWFSLLWHVDGLGYMLSKKLIEPEMVYNFGGGTAQILQWKKWESVILEMRKKSGDPEYLRWFEYTVEEMMRIRQEKGLSPTP